MPVCFHLFLLLSWKYELDAYCSVQVRTGKVYVKICCSRWFSVATFSSMHVLSCSSRPKKGPLCVNGWWSSRKAESVGWGAAVKTARGVQRRYWQRRSWERSWNCSCWVTEYLCWCTKALARLWDSMYPCFPHNIELSANRLKGVKYVPLGLSFMGLVLSLLKLLSLFAEYVKICTQVMTVLQPATWKLFRSCARKSKTLVLLATFCAGLFCVPGSISIWLQNNGKDEIVQFMNYNVTMESITATHSFYFEAIAL